MRLQTIWRKPREIAKLRKINFAVQVSAYAAEPGVYLGIKKSMDVAR
jgi:hypothetical protein